MRKKERKNQAAKRKNQGGEEKQLRERERRKLQCSSIVK
jgi:hypothetical protein